jgi:tetratricopeptide (TPR) repeat protein
MFQSLFFDEGQIDRIGEILKFPIDRETQEYYRVVDVCYTGIHNCIITIEAYSGMTQSLLTLQSLSKSAVFITPDYQYRNITIAAKFYEYGMYGASVRLAREILENRPDYLEAKKILAFSLAGLGKYQDAKKYLLEYSEKNPDDLETIVQLGEVYASLGDIVSSNLSLNNAIISGYTPKTDLERRLAYNYSLLGDTPALMRVLNYLLQEIDVKEDDYAVGISLALAEGDIARARNWAVDGLKKFEDSSMILPLYIESLRLSSERDYARMVIENTNPEVQKENPNFLLQKALITFEYGEYESARDIFDELSDLDDWPDIQEEARAYIESIDRILSEKEQEESL